MTSEREKTHIISHLSHHAYSIYFLAMLEKWKTTLDKRKLFGALLTGLTKSFDCLPQTPYLAKLHGYGFNVNALKEHSKVCDNFWHLKAL